MICSSACSFPSLTFTAVLVNKDLNITSATADVEILCYTVSDNRTHRFVPQKLEKCLHLSFVIVSCYSKHNGDCLCQSVNQIISLKLI